MIIYLLATLVAWISRSLSTVFLHGENHWLVQSSDLSEWWRLQHRTLSWEEELESTSVDCHFVHLTILVRLQIAFLYQTKVRTELGLETAEVSGEGASSQLWQMSILELMWSHTPLKLVFTIPFKHTAEYLFHSWP